MSHTTSIKSVSPRSITALRRAVAEHVRNGIQMELLERAKPRMYYPDQMQKHLKRKDEIADLVIRVKDAFYDIALLKQEDGSYSIHFDDYSRPSPYSAADDKGTRMLSDVLGIPYEGPREHWAGEKVDPAQATHSIAKFLQCYSKHAALEVAEAGGWMQSSCTIDEHGNTVLTVSR